MTNFEIMKDFINSLDEDEEIKSLQEEYELSENDNSKLTKGLIEKSLYFDEKGKILTLEEWKEIYIETAIMVTSYDYDISTGKKRPRPKNFVSKYINQSIEKLGMDSEIIDDTYDDGNTFTK